MKLSKLKVGDIVLADAGFNCLTAGEHTVAESEGELFIPCSYGKHYLKGHVDVETDEVIGFSKP